jgi:hypothetical protein
MAHFAHVVNGTVVNVIVVENHCAPTEEEGKAFIASIGLQGDYVQTSYNTYRDADGVPQHKLGGTPFRGQYAGFGDYYDAELDEFVTLPKN